MSLAIKCYPKGVYGENTYLIEDEATGYKAIIDPGYYDMEVRMDIANNIYLKYVLLTHGHHDHYFAANKYLQEYSSVKFCAPDKERYLIGKGKCPDPTDWLKEGDIITLGETELRVIETPGHTEGGICFATDSALAERISIQATGILSETRSNINFTSSTTISLYSRVTESQLP